jgi:hypothetical protein
MLKVRHTNLTIAKAKAFYSELLGVEPFADGPYYVGFRIGDLEIGLDPHGRTEGPIAYWEVKDIRTRLRGCSRPARRLTRT